MHNLRSSIVTTSASEAEVQTLTFADARTVPNNPALPVLCFRQAVAAQAGAAAIRELIEANGWGGTWKYTVFDYHHYHPNAHEVLVVASGGADLLLGGPGGETVHVEAGDALVLPAGTGHRRADATPDFQVCGGYPPGQEDYETLKTDEQRPDDVLARIAQVPIPETDPIFGANGPLMQLWPRTADGN